MTCLSISFFNVHFPCHILAAMSWRLNCLLKRFYYSKNWCWLLSYASIIYSCTSSLSLYIVRCIQAFSTSLQIAFIFLCLTFYHNGVFISYVIIRHCWKINYPDKLNFPYRSCSTEVPVKLIWHLSVSFASAVWHNVDDDVICRTKYHRACRYSFIPAYLASYENCLQHTHGRLRIGWHSNWNVLLLLPFYWQCNALRLLRYTFLCALLRVNLL